MCERARWRVHYPTPGDTNYYFRDVPEREYPFPTLLQLACRDYISKSEDELYTKATESESECEFEWDYSSYEQAFDECLWPQFVPTPESFLPVQMILERRWIQTHMRIKTNPVTYSSYKWRIVWVDPSVHSYPEPHFSASYLGVIYTDLRSGRWTSWNGRGARLPPWRLWDIYSQLRSTWEPYVGEWKYQAELNLMLPLQEHDDQRWHEQIDVEEQLNKALQRQYQADTDAEQSVARMVRPRLGEPQS